MNCAALSLRHVVLGSSASQFDQGGVAKPINGTLDVHITLIKERRDHAHGVAHVGLHYLRPWSELDDSQFHVRKFGERFLVNAKLCGEESGRDGLVFT